MQCFYANIRTVNMTWKQKTLQPVTGRQCISGSIIHDSSLINSLDGGYYSNWDEKAEAKK